MLGAMDSTRNIFNVRKRRKHRHFMQLSDFLKPAPKIDKKCKPYVLSFWHTIGNRHTYWDIQQLDGRSFPFQPKSTPPTSGLLHNSIISTRSNYISNIIRTKQKSLIALSSWKINFLLAIVARKIPLWQKSTHHDPLSTYLCIWLTFALHWARIIDQSFRQWMHFEIFNQI